MTRLSTSAPRIGRVTLLGGAAAAALLLAAGQARAQVHPNDACGAPVDGIVTCAPGAAYPDGVWYGGEMTDPVVIRLEDGVSISPINYRAGLHAVTQNAAITFDGSGASVSTQNADAVSAFVEGLGDITIRIGQVSTVADDGAGARGVVATNDEGSIIIDVDAVSTVGDYASGIVAQSLFGDVSVRAGAVETRGAFAEGIAVSTFGAINIDVGSVVTNGDQSFAIVAEGGLAPILINAGSIATTGLASDGVTVVSGGDVNIRVDSIQGQGDHLWGVNLVNGLFDETGQVYAGSSLIYVSDIALSGFANRGLYTESYGSVNAVVDSLRIDGVDGLGAAVIGVQNAFLHVEDAYFTGEGTGGVRAISEYTAAVSVGSLYSESGGGLSASSRYGAVSAFADRVDVGGFGAAGVALETVMGPAEAYVGDIVTRGFSYADGLAIFAYNGAVRSQVNSISTLGDVSRGAYVHGRTVDLVVQGAVTTRGASSDGLIATSTFGHARVFAAGPVSTVGDLSNGLWITGRNGVSEVQTAGTVKTAGDRAHGVFAEAQNGQVRVVSADISTSGAGSHGVQARTLYAEEYIGQPVGATPPPWTGDIDIRAAAVSATGQGARAVSARGIGDARLVLGDVSSRQDFAVEANMIGDVALELRGTARSDQASAVFLQGERLDVSIAAGARVQGAVDGLVLTAGARCVLPSPPTFAFVNPCPNPGNHLLFPEEPVLTQPIQAGGTSTVVNGGTVAAGSGYAVRQTHGALSLDNRGQILGALQTSDGNDRFANAGLWEIGKDSDFGAGVDLVANTGVVRFAAAATPRAIALRNLERFENAGTVDLRNGAVGDSLTVSGDFVGQAGSTVGLDVDLQRGVADRIVIGGAATGTTLLRFNGDYSTATLGAADGIVVVQAGAGSSEAAFALAPEAGRQSFVGHSLDFDAATRRFVLHSAASEAAWRQLGLIQALEDVSTSGFDLWRGQAALSRDAAFTGDAARGFWFALQGGESSRDWSTVTGTGEALDLSYRQDRYGAQFGHDLALTPTLQAGVTAGYGQSTLEYNVSGDSFDVSTFSVGGHLSTVRGSAFASVKVKYDRHDVELASTALSQDVEIEATTWGADVEAGYRFGGPDLFLEPLAGVRWTSASADDLVNGAQRIAWDDGEDLALRAGFRLGGGRSLAGGSSLSFYGGASVLHGAGDDYGVRLTAGESEVLSADRVGTWGQGVFGLTYRTGTGLETYAEGQGDLGSDYDAVSARIGMRLRF